MSVWAILVAAGRGERLGLEQPKAFAKLGEDPLLAEPLRRLDESDWIDRIVIVAPPGWEEPAILLAEELACSKVHACVSGGRTRTESVRAGVDEVPPDALVVLVHDAARPLLQEAVIERVLAPLSEGWDGVVPGLPVSDTLKRVAADGAIEETVARDSLYAVQTPQAFLADVLRRAVAGGADATDCAGLVEAGGGRVKVVEGDPLLLKVTTADDLAEDRLVAVTAVVFDVGETLVDETRAWKEAAAHGKVPEFTLMGVVGGLAARGEDHRRAFTLLGFAPPPLPPVESADFYDDAVPCLERLRASGYAVGLAGNQPAHAREALLGCGLDVDFVATSGSWGVEKPAPEFFERVIGESRRTAAEIAYVGDRVDNDVIPAKRAGMVAVHIRRGPWGYLHGTEEADATIASLDELPAVLP